MGYFQRATCRNCWEPIDQFVSTAVETEPNWTHGDGSIFCPRTTAEPAD